MTTLYYVKPKIIVAPISSGQLKEFDLGDNILVLASKTVWKNFKLDELFGSLGVDRQFEMFDHIRPDAPFSDLDGVIQARDKNRPSSIIAIGGGSIIDAAKALSVAFEGNEFRDIFYKRRPMPENKIPVLAIPTTAGTGAELSFGAIIFDDINGIKGGLRGPILQPDWVLIDARLHNACPKKLKAEVGFDCLTHAVETYISRQHNKLVRYHSVACIRDVFRYLVPACIGKDLGAMEKLAINAALMGINLAYSSTCLPHRIQYVIGPITQTSHAQGLIALYKGWLPHLAASEIPDFKELCTELEMSRETFLYQVQQLRERLKIDYNLSGLGISKYQLGTICEQVTGNMEADPSYRGPDSIKQILKLSL